MSRSVLATLSPSSKDQLQGRIQQTIALLSYCQTLRTLWGYNMKAGLNPTIAGWLQSSVFVSMYPHFCNFLLLLWLVFVFFGSRWFLLNSSLMTACYGRVHTGGFLLVKKWCCFSELLFQTSIIVWCVCGCGCYYFFFFLCSIEIFQFRSFSAQHTCFY